jgi:hypothetical protein
LNPSLRHTPSFPFLEAISRRLANGRALTLAATIVLSLGSAALG